ncbi:hypothetical protein E3O44_12250 [Cryobacterium algoricola]|uniref:Uncharacterized protein n=2 Tax=Cryobacterium TaxID=69578 RepID=A0AA41QWN8_9MICO|nr:MULTISPECIES: hypothetical protein [Cryobacterium]MCI4658003.1 hypothetical protein [Cryobacterium zhongshanensis]TFB86223.1 hypothetical protein E3O44_12250 [Cryobacterium algoricola]
MTESELVNLWIKARWHVIVSQVAPTFLLTALVGFLALGLAGTAPSVRVAAAGVLLASGILGALVQINAANEALAVIADLRAGGSTSAVTLRIVSAAPWVNVVRFVTPAVFVVVYVALLIALFVR